MANAREIVNKAIEAYRERDIDAIMALTADDAVLRGPGGVDGSELRGHAAIRADAEEGFASAPNAEFEVLRQVAEGDTVVTEFKMTRTHTGPVTLATGEKIDATGRRIRQTMVSIDRVADGKIVETTMYYDRHSVLVQLGLLPEPATVSS
jgi:hypothetical protein